MIDVKSNIEYLKQFHPVNDLGLMDLATFVKKPGKKIYAHYLDILLDTILNRHKVNFHLYPDGKGNIRFLKLKQ